MLTERPEKVYISSANVDMRKSIDGLSAIVSSKFELNPMSKAMFVFHNLHCDKVKILYWDGSGFCLLYKRMEHDKFKFPKRISAEKYEITPAELTWLMNGLKIEEIRKYEALRYVKNTDFPPI